MSKTTNTPAFDKPTKEIISGTSPFHRKLLNFVFRDGFKPENWAYWYVLLPDRKRKFRPERVEALKPVLQFLARYVNLVDLTINLSCFRTISDQTNLTTVSDNGNTSISRVWRLFSEVLIAAGVVESAKLPFDKILKENLPAFLTVTPLFFELCGISEEELHREREKRLRYKGLLDPELAGFVGIRKLQEVAKKNHIAKNFERLKLKKEEARAQRKIKALVAKEHSEQLHEIGKAIIQDYTDCGQLELLTPALFRQESLKRQGLYKKLAVT